MPPASLPLPNPATGFYKFAFIDFVGLCPIFFQKRYSSSPDQSCLTDQSLCINGSDLRSDYFISLTQLTNHYGINSVNKLVVFCFPFGLRKSKDSSWPIGSLEYWPTYKDHWPSRLPSYAAPQLPFLLYVPTARLQKWAVLPRFRCKALSRHAKKKKLPQTPLV